jgi:hypothetical protein
MKGLRDEHCDRCFAPWGARFDATVLRAPVSGCAPVTPAFKPEHKVCSIKCFPSTSKGMNVIMATSV